VDRGGRITIFNAYSEAIGLAQIESEIFNENRRVATLIPEIAPGTASESFVLAEGAVPLVVIAPGSEATIQNPAWDGTQGVLSRLSDFEVERDSAHLIVVTGERITTGDTETVRALAVPLTARTSPLFGSPHAVGQALFTVYMLPFQMIAVLLLVAMIGAVVLTHKEPVLRRVAARRKVSRPLTTVIAAQTGHDVLKSEEATEAPSGD
jgi:hypothetical protein